MKVACTVWSGGKARDDIRGLPITIELRLRLPSEPGKRRPADFVKGAEHLAQPAELHHQFQRR